MQKSAKKLNTMPSAFVGETTSFKNKSPSKVTTTLLVRFHTRFMSAIPSPFRAKKKIIGSMAYNSIGTIIQ